ncbi:MAG: hypothetical protein WBE13_16045 [Candidatus Acidiferrum sp.]
MKLLLRSRWIAAIGIIGLGIGVVLVARGTSKAGPARTGVPYDWSHRSVVFSRPATRAQLLKIGENPRYWQQVIRRSAVLRGSADEVGRGGRPTDPYGWHDAAKNSLTRDWAVSLGPGATTGTATYPQFPAKYSYSINPADETCADFAAFTTNLPGVTGTSDADPGQPTIIAYQNLYSGGPGDGVDSACVLPAPTIAWAYNTNAAGDTAGVVSGSPTISADGSKLAFVESNAGGSVLHLLFYAVGDGFDPVTGNLETAAPTTVLTSGSSWTDCPTTGTSCMISLPLAGNAATAVNSSPFYDFATDELYLGDANGVLHKFTGVFNGTPTEVTTGWPITVHASVALTPPVFDSVSDNVFVGDADGVLSFVMDTGSTTGTCASGTPPCLGAATIQATSGSGFPIIDPPTLDPTTGKVFVFVGDTGTLSCVTARNACVIQVNTDLSGKATQSVGAYGVALHAGSFDNAYLDSSAPTITGDMFVCGKGTLDRPTLRRIGFSADGTIESGGITTLSLGGVTGAQCSPVTEIYNPTAGTPPGTPTDFIFFSVQSGDLARIGNAATNCVGTGCVMGAIVTSGAVPASLSSSAPELGGTSGIIIDNVGTYGEDSSLYFSRLGQTALSTCGGTGSTTVGCAVKLTQSGFN